MNLEEKINKMVKEINIYKGATLYNKAHDRYYKINKYLEIVFNSGNVINIDLDTNEDISYVNHIEIVDKGKLKKNIFTLNLLGKL